MKLGIHASDTREIVFANARVPKENLLGEHNKGYTVALATLGGGRIGIAAQALGHRAGVARGGGALRRRAQAVRPPDRRVRRDPRDARQHRRSRSTPRGCSTYQAAWLRDQGRPHVKEASLAKWHASEAATALRELGDPGARRLRLPDRVPRRALLARRPHHEIYEGTTEVQKMVVAAQVLKEHAIAGPHVRPVARRRSIRSMNSSRPPRRARDPDRLHGLSRRRRCCSRGSIRSSPASTSTWSASRARGWTLAAEARHPADRGARLLKARDRRGVGRSACSASGPATDARYPLALLGGGGLAALSRGRRW